MNIIHPYGIVAPLHGGRGSVPLGAPSPNYAMLIDNLKIYTERHAAGEILTAIAEMMSSAQQIAFLGLAITSRTSTFSHQQSRLSQSQSSAQRRNGPPVIVKKCMVGLPACSSQRRQRSTASHRSSSTLT